MTRKKWTRNAIIAAIREYADLNGRPPRATEWFKPSNGRWPSVSAVSREFGRWSYGLRAAGFEPATHRHDKPIRKPKWTKEEIIAAIQQWAEVHDNHPPTWNDWRVRQPPYPGSTSVLNQFGTWNAAVKAAGFTPHPKHVTRRAVQRLTPWVPEPREEGDDAH